MENRFNKTHFASLLFLLTLSFLIFCRFDENQDIYFILNHGRYILQNGFTNVEPFTIHEGLAFSFEKWLFCIAAYTLYKYTGMIGLNICSIILSVIILYVYYRIFYWINKNKQTSFVFTCFVATIFFMFDLYSKRPSLISNLIFLIEIYCLEKFIQENKIKYLIVLPVLANLLIQIHSTIFPVFYLFAIPFLFITDQRKIIKLFICGCCCFLIALINPFGIDSIFYLVNALRSSSQKLLQIYELEPLSITEYMLFITVMIFVYIKLHYRSNNIPFRYNILFYLLLLLVFYAIRNMQFFVLLTCIVFGYILKDISFKNTPTILFTLSFICLLFGILLFNRGDAKIDNYKGSIFTENNLKDYSMTEKLNGKIYCEYEVGSYLEWLNLTPYIDTRSEVFTKEINKKEDILAEYITTRYGILSLETLQEKYNFDYYYIAKTNALNTAIKERTSWIAIDETDDYIVYEVTK